MQNNQNAVTQIYVQNTTSGASAMSGIMLGDGTANGVTQLSHLNTSYAASGLYAANTSFLGGYDTGGMGVGTEGATAPLFFYTGGHAVANQRMTILSGGNVGIGITAPAERLDVGGGNVKMGRERIGTTCYGTPNCVSYCTAGKMATGGSCLISVGTWTRIENSGEDNYYSCFSEAPQAGEVATVYCANIR